MEKIAVLGSTGSTGAQTLEVVRYSEDTQVTAPATGDNAKLVEEQIRELKPGLVCLWGEEKAKELWATVVDLDVRVASGIEGLVEAAMSSEADLVVTAVVRVIGIRPAIIAVETGKDIALANKETLVTVGHIIMSLVREKGVKLLPVDSEHSAVSQCLQNTAGNLFHKMLLTASGDPFRGLTGGQSKQVRLEDALKHPNWPMGHKIIIDSPTVVNKGLEVMGACWLFGMEMGQVQMAIQPASIIHSMVEFKDGVVIAQLGMPDMKLPIQYALYYPEHRFLPGKQLDFAKPGQIIFEIPDVETSRGLKLAYEVGRRGGTLSAVFNAANEMAAALFLERKISYLTIVDMVEGAMEHHCMKPSSDMAQILEAEQEIYDCIKSEWN